MSMVMVLTNGMESVEVGPVVRGGGLILHAAIGNHIGFTVSHEKTGASVFTGQPREVAEYFFRFASKWPEWQQRGNNVDDYGFLRDRVMALRREAQQVAELMAETP